MAMAIARLRHKCRRGTPAMFQPILLFCHLMVVITPSRTITDKKPSRTLRRHGHHRSGHWIIGVAVDVLVLVSAGFALCVQRYPDRHWVVIAISGVLGCVLVLRVLVLLMLALSVAAASLIQWIQVMKAMRRTTLSPGSPRLVQLQAPWFMLCHERRCCCRCRHHYRWSWR
jgi:hypothetical protein